MSNVRDLFAGGGTSQLGFSLRREPISEYFVIDGESRTITAPSDFQNFGVESDEKTKRIYFECPQFVGDGKDLTTMNLRVNYQNANGEKDSYIVTDVESDGEKIHFSWVLSRKCTAYKGTVKFIVCAIKTNTSGEILNEWNTTLCSGDVLEGLEVDNTTIEESTSDLYDQLVNLVNTSVADVEKTRDAALAEIQSAPTLEHSTRFANALKATASGEVVRVDDVSPNEHYASVKVYGENIDPTTVTVTRCGKNLLKLDNISKSITNTDGMNLAASISDGQISLSGTFNAGSSKGKVIYSDMTIRNVNYHSYAYILEELAFKIPRGTYVFSANESISEGVDVISGAYLLVGELNGSVKDGTATNYKSGTTFTVDNDNYYCMFIVYLYGAGAFENFKYTAKPLLEFGSTTTVFESYSATPYTPNADGTVDILSVSPTMTLFTDTAGANIDVEYNQDTNAYKKDVQKELSEADRLIADLISKTYVADFFRQIPDGKTIDDLTEPGTYIGYENAHYNSSSYTMPFILFVSNHNSLDEFDYAKTCQMRIYCNPLSEIGDNIMQCRLYENNGWTAWETIYATPQFVLDEIAKIPTGGETWELLQSHEVTEEDGELSELKITFPEGYKEYVVSLERTAPTESTNTIIYPYGKKADGNGELTAFWDYYEGSNASHYELRFSSMELDADNYIKLEGYTYVTNQPVKGKPQTMKTSGWINIGTYGNKVSSWHSVTFKTKLNVGSKYKVWGCK